MRTFTWSIFKKDKETMYEIETSEEEVSLYDIFFFDEIEQLDTKLIKNVEKIFKRKKFIEKNSHNVLSLSPFDLAVMLNSYGVVEKTIKFLKQKNLDNIEKYDTNDLNSNPYYISLCAKNDKMLTLLDCQEVSDLYYNVTIHKLLCDNGKENLQCVKNYNDLKALYYTRKIKLTEYHEKLLGIMKKKDEIKKIHIVQNSSFDKVFTVLKLLPIGNYLVIQNISDVEEKLNGIIKHFFDNIYYIEINTIDKKKVVIPIRYEKIIIKISKIGDDKGKVQTLLNAEKKEDKILNVAVLPTNYDDENRYIFGTTKKYVDYLISWLKNHSDKIKKLKASQIESQIGTKVYDISQLCKNWEYMISIKNEIEYNISAYKLPNFDQWLIGISLKELFGNLKKEEDIKRISNCDSEEPTECVRRLTKTVIYIKDLINKEKFESENSIKRIIYRSTVNTRVAFNYLFSMQSDTQIVDNMYSLAQNIRDIGNVALKNPKENYNSELINTFYWRTDLTIPKIINETGIKKEVSKIKEKDRRKIDDFFKNEYSKNENSKLKLFADVLKIKKGPYNLNDIYSQFYNQHDQNLKDLCDRVNSLFVQEGIPCFNINKEEITEFEKRVIGYTKEFYQDKIKGDERIEILSGLCLAAAIQQRKFKDALCILYGSYKVNDYKEVTIKQFETIIKDKLGDKIHNSANSPLSFVDKENYSYPLWLALSYFKLFSYDSFESNGYGIINSWESKIVDFYDNDKEYNFMIREVYELNNENYIYRKDLTNNIKNFNSELKAYWLLLVTLVLITPEEGLKEVVTNDNLIESCIINKLKHHNSIASSFKEECNSIKNRISNYNRLDNMNSIAILELIEKAIKNYLYKEN